jgi:hypothetical protein
MKLKYQYDKIEDVPEALKDSYVEKAGKWLLDVDLKQADDFKTVWQEVLTLRKEREDLSGKVSGFGELTPDEVKAMQDRIKEMEASASLAKDPTEVQKLAEEITKQRTKPLLSDIAALKAQQEALAKERDQYQRTLLDKELESKLRNTTNGKIRDKAFMDIYNAAKLEGLKWNKDSGDFYHEQSGMQLKEWFESHAEDRGWLPESVSGGASGGRGGRGAAGTQDWGDIVHDMWNGKR